MTYGNYAARHNDYMYKYEKKYGNPTPVYSGSSSSTSASKGVYASGISDAGFVANTCTDGKDDGKIGFFAAVGNALEGAGKGIVNGIKGMFTNSEGKFSLGKTLLSAGLVALCFACPAIGVAACAIGAVAGGVQVFKGAKAAANAKTDAEAKAAWENMGEGTSTVIGCALGAKASLGAMKSASSLAAIDDVAKAAGKSVDDVLGSVDDLAKVMDSADDSAKAATKFLKSKGITNADDVLSSVDDVTDATKIMDAAKTRGKSSSLDALKAKDLKGAKKLTETVKAFGKDAVSSTRNNGRALWKKASTTYRSAKGDIQEYSGAKTTRNKLQSEIKQMEKALKEMDDSTDEAMELGAAIKIKKQALETADDALNGTKIQQLKQSGAETVKNYRLANKEYNAAKKALRTATREGRKQGLKGDGLTSYTSAQQQAVNAAKAKTPFGQLTASFRENTNLGQALSQLKTNKNIIKTITSNMNKETLTAIKNALSEDGLAVWSFLTKGEGTYAQAVQQYGYSNVLEVVKVLFAYGQTEQIIL